MATTGGVQVLSLFNTVALPLAGEGSLWVVFDDPEVLDYPWDLSPYDAAPTATDLAVLGAGLKVQGNRAM